MIETLLPPPIQPRDPNPGPGFIIAGDKEIGYYGTLQSTDFIDGPALATLIGLTAGTSINPDTDWLKLSYHGKVMYVPKKPYRVDLSWNDILQVNAVAGARVILIKGKQYNIRLMRGSKLDPYTGINGASDDPATIGSEYNDLMYRVCTVDPPSQTLPNIANFTPEELGMYSPGGVQLCMERSTPPETLAGILCRGNGANNIATSHSPAENYSAGRGWRPVIVPV